MRVDAHKSRRPTRARDRRAREEAFGLIEILVVMIIIAILSAAILSTMRGQKKTSAFKLAQASAHSYAEAVESFMADNGRVPPPLSSAADAGWPSASDKMDKGPVDHLMVGNDGGPLPYLRQVPEGVSDGRVDLLASATETSSAPAVIVYTTTADTYTFEVSTNPNEDDEPLRCVITNSTTPPADVQRCD